MLLVALALPPPPPAPHGLAVLGALAVMELVPPARQMVVEVVPTALAVVTFDDDLPPEPPHPDAMAASKNMEQVTPTRPGTGAYASKGHPRSSHLARALRRAVPWASRSGTSDRGRSTHPAKRSSVG